jgi:hypothetical protein
VKTIRKRLLANAIGTLLAVASAGAAAVDVGDVLTIHGFGNQDYMASSNGNTYLGATSAGTWDRNILALLFTAKVDENVSIWAQLHSSVDTTYTHLDWMFVNYQVNNDFTWRAGQIKVPMGLYNEIRDIKYLQLSALEPMVYQEAMEILHEAFRGASAIYKHGDFTLDVFAGQNFELVPPAGETFGEMIGGRLTYKAPVNGLRFMVSGYNSGMTDTNQAKQQSDKQVLMFSADYTANNLDAKAEYAQSRMFGVDSYTWYTQVGYTIAEKWVPYVRYDYATTDQDQKDDPSYYQKDASFGVSYKINSNVGVRIEDHRFRGYALPVASGEMAAGTGSTNWNMIFASVYFIF